MKDSNQDLLQLLVKIASDNTSFSTLDTSNSGDDFKEVAVWQLKSALIEAYTLGLASGSKSVTVPKPRPQGSEA